MTELEKKFAAARNKIVQSPQRRKQMPPINAAAIEPADEQRRARTHRLVQLGALAEKYLDMKGIEPTEAEQLLKRLVGCSEVKRIVGGGK